MAKTKPNVIANAMKKTVMKVMKSPRAMKVKPVVAEQKVKRAGKGVMQKPAGRTAKVKPLAKRKTTPKPKGKSKGKDACSFYEASTRR